MPFRRLLLAFTLAFIAAGAFLLSLLFGLIGATAVVWLTSMIATRWLSRRRHRDVTPSGSTHQGETFKLP
jgi:O-antigen/teichoic acid export membrane protein